MKRSTPHPSTLQKAFSLAELLVAMGITSLLMLTLFTLVGQSTTTYTHTQRAINSVSQARAFLQFIDRELATRLPGTPLIHQQKSTSLTGPTASERLGFIRALNPDEFSQANPGDLGTSIYYVAFSPDGSTGESPKLFHKLLNPTATQALIEQGNNPTLPSQDPLTDEPIVPNILSFAATPMFRDPSTSTLMPWDPTSSPTPPSLIELKITFIDETSAQRYRSQAEWNRLTTSPRTSELQLIRTFTRTLSITQ